jgi:uncharacterized protein (DUF58 family)
MFRLLYRLFRLSDAVGRSLAKRLTPLGSTVLGTWVAAGLIGLDTNQSLSYQIFAFLAALLGVATIASQFFRFRFVATRSLPRFGTVGQPLTYKISLQNQTRKAQRGLQLYEEIAETGYPRFSEFIGIIAPERRGKRKLRKSKGGKEQLSRYLRWFEFVAQRRRAIAEPVDLPILQPNHPTEVSLTVMPLQRGLLRMTGLTVGCPDPLGLVKAQRTLTLPQSVLILPQLYQVPPILLPGWRRYQSGGVALSSAVGDSQEFRALRDYRQGDSPRKIHWKSWAKVGKPVVKEEQDEFFVRHALLLDTFIQPIAGDRCFHEQFEAAVSVAASFACQVQTQDSLLDLMFVGLEAHCFTVGRGLGQSDRMLEILASVMPCETQSFADLVPLVMERLSLLSGCICVFLSWDAARKNFIQRLEKLQIPTLVLLIQADERDANLATDDSALELPAHVRILRLGQIQEGLMAL